VVKIKEQGYFKGRNKMKIEQGKVFAPVVITLETRGELDNIRTALELLWCNVNLETAQLNYFVKNLRDSLDDK